MTTTTHELARELLELEDRPVRISVDVSTGEHDWAHRVFAIEYHGINDEDASPIVLLFSGKPNY